MFVKRECHRRTRLSEWRAVVHKMCNSQGRINKCEGEGPVRKHLFGLYSTHRIRVKGQMTAFCSVFVIQFQCQFLYAVVHTFRLVCSRVVFLIVTNRQLWRHKKFWHIGVPKVWGGPGSAEHVRTFLNPALICAVVKLTLCLFNRWARISPPKCSAVLGGRDTDRAVLEIIFKISRRMEMAGVKSTVCGMESPPHPQKLHGAYFQMHGVKFGIT